MNQQEDVLKQVVSFRSITQNSARQSTDDSCVAAKQYGQSFSVAIPNESKQTLVGMDSKISTEISLVWPSYRTLMGGTNPFRSICGTVALLIAIARESGFTEGTREVTSDRRTHVVPFGGASTVS
jgi:hypothetical protein